MMQKQITEIWDENQLDVIKAGFDECILVDAGPGTGKTAVACARLAYLIEEEDLEPSNTWMISFTRTAVAEIRARLHRYVGDDALAIRIATVDSHAWSIHSGHDAGATLTGTYEENIERVIELLEHDGDVAEELNMVEHLVVDEAQDIVGARAHLVELLISKLSPDCGVTVFADEAQAIYGFAEKREDLGVRHTLQDVTPLLARLGEMKFKKLALKEIYRTSSGNLKRIFSELRTQLLRGSEDANGLHGQIASQIRQLADSSDLTWTNLKVEDYDAEALLLFRSRIEVLMKSQFAEAPHRRRLSGYSASLPAWIALCFSDYLDRYISERAFLQLWSSRIENRIASEYQPIDAWAKLLTVAGENDGSVDLHQLRRKLSRTHPPTELAIPEFGLAGPIVGTIHASKGREEDTVVLMLPRQSDFDDAEGEAEETRVLFVGATRARERLFVGSGITYTGSALDSQRAYRSKRNGPTMVEIGRTGDLNATGLVGRGSLSREESAASQQFLSISTDVMTEYSLKLAGQNLDWRYLVLRQDSSEQIAVLSKQFSNELWNILSKLGQEKSRKPPHKIRHVKSFGCTTVAIAPDDVILEELHEPWSRSGFILAPRIASFSPVFFAKR